MKLKKSALVIAFLILVGSTLIVSADTYSTFQTTRYYSANRDYLVVVNERRLATLYENGRTLHRVWRRTLPDLPGELMVANDGRRVILIERYYGNNHVSTLKVITILGETGKEIASYQLREVANLERVSTTISATHWFGGAEFSEDGRSLVIKTVVAKRLCWQPPRSVEESKECGLLVPYEQLHFDVATGRMIERTLLP